MNAFNALLLELAGRPVAEPTFPEAPLFAAFWFDAALSPPGPVNEGCCIAGLPTRAKGLPVICGANPPPGPGLLGVENCGLLARLAPKEDCGLKGCTLLPPNPVGCGCSACGCCCGFEDEAAPPNDMDPNCEERSLALDCPVGVETAPGVLGPKADPVVLLLP